MARHSESLSGSRALGPFTAHPASVGETWSQHARVALGFASSLALAAMAATVHAVLPFAFETTASRAVDRLHARIHGPRCADTAEDPTVEHLAA